MRPVGAAGSAPARVLFTNSPPPQGDFADLLQGAADDGARGRFAPEGEVPAAGLGPSFPSGPGDAAAFDAEEEGAFVDEAGEASMVDSTAPSDPAQEDGADEDRGASGGDPLLDAYALAFVALPAGGGASIAAPTGEGRGGEAITPPSTFPVDGAFAALQAAPRSLDLAAAGAPALPVDALAASQAALRPDGFAAPARRANATLAAPAVAAAPSLALRADAAPNAALRPFDFAAAPAPDLRADAAFAPPRPDMAPVPRAFSGSTATPAGGPRPPTARPSAAHPAPAAPVDLPRADLSPALRGEAAAFAAFGAAPAEAPGAPPPAAMDPLHPGIGPRGEALVEDGGDEVAGAAPRSAGPGWSWSVVTHLARAVARPAPTPILPPRPARTWDSTPWFPAASADPIVEEAAPVPLFEEADAKTLAEPIPDGLLPLLGGAPGPARVAAPLPGLGAASAAPRAPEEAVDLLPARISGEIDVVVREAEATLRVHLSTHAQSLAVHVRAPEAQLNGLVGLRAEVETALSDSGYDLDSFEASADGERGEERPPAHTPSPSVSSTSAPAAPLRGDSAVHRVV